MFEKIDGKGISGSDVDEKIEGMTENGNVGMRSSEGLAMIMELPLPLPLIGGYADMASPV